MKKKVLHLLMSNSVGGAEVEVCNLINNCDLIEGIYCSESGDIDNYLLKNDIKFFNIKKINLFNLRKVVNNIKPDIIHAHDYKASVLASLIGFKGEIISHIHYSPEFIEKYNFKSILYFFRIKRFKYIVAVSNSIFENAIFKSKLKSKEVIISNYIDKNKILKNLNNIPIKSKYDVAFIGRFEEIKNPIFFIELVEEIYKEKQDIKAVMVGNGTLYEKCKNIIINKKLDKIIDLKGFISEPFNLISESRITVITSNREGFGLVAVESMVIRRPVVARKVGGLIDILGDESGILCENKDEFKKAILDLLNDKELYNKILKKSNSKVEEYTNKHIFKTSVNKLYEDKYE